MRKALNKLVPVMLALIMLVTAGTFAKAETATQTEVVEIATAEELLAINGNLGGNYILTEDIDLSSYENWPMIGKYVMDPNSPEGEDPVAEAAFTGVFDGNGHTISNVTIDASADMERMFGVGFFSCVGRGGVVRNVVFRDINVKGMMLVGGVVGYAFECTMDNVDLSASGRNTIGSTMVMAGGVIGGLTCSKCVNCDVENTDILAAPGGNSGILGGGFSKPVLENCTVKNSTLSGSMDGAPAFGMDGGSWLGGLTGCVNLDDYDVREWYVKNCSVSDAEITISGKGSCVGGLIGSAGGEVKNPEDPRMTISGCKVENVTITVTDSIPCVGGAVGGSFTEGGPMNSFLLDDCTLANVVISTDAEDLEASKTGLLIGEAANCQFVTKGGELLDITDRTAAAEEINSRADVTIRRADGSSFEDAALVGQVAADAGDAPSDAGEAAALLEAVKGTYVPLFPVITDPKYDRLWLDPCAAILGEEAAPAAAEELKAACNGTIYGQEAIDAFGDGSNGMQFDCLFINGVSTITFDGNVISGADENGSQVFSHEYAYAGRFSLAGMMEGYLYETADENAGEFRYFFMMPDTPDSTYHLEFRYGADRDALALYNEGPYAYWLAAGFPADADEAMTENVIDLFVLENMDYSAHAPEAVAQLNDLGFAGAWQADMTPFGEAYASVDLSMTIDGNGHGVTMMNGAQTADFEAFVADTGEKGDGQGLYIAYSNLEGEAESAPYAFSVSEDGKPVLTLTADDGVISWVRKDAAPEVIEIATAEELAAVKQNLSGHYVLTADIDLNGAAWEPLGVFVPGSDENGEPTELPDLDSAFTGTFDGNGHTISNFTITQGEGAYTAGLFGCLANATVTSLTVKDVSAEGFLMVSDVAGYSFMSSISGVKLENGSIHVIPNELSEEGMFGGIVGAGMGSVITDCEAEVNITIEEGKTANVGIIGGGWQNTSAANCTGHGSIKAGSDCYGFGGVSGCGFGAEYITGCVAEDVSITVGDNCSHIGGITGYCGGYEPAELGVPVTKVTDCRTKNVTITTGDGAENTGDFVGGGFLSDEMIVYGPPFDQPTSYELVNCVAE